MSMLSMALRTAPHITDIEFCAWLAQAERGDRLTYHVGYLAIDRLAVLSPLGDQGGKQLSILADCAWRAAESGLCHLVQRRLGPDRFAYVAVARKAPKTVGAALKTLLDDIAA